ncbi:MAG: hypothetical protein ACR2N2_06270 [Acidimicrobiia bacterium]
MSDDQTPMPVCVHCGTARPADEPVCPNCGKPWIDERVDPDAGVVPSPAGTDEAAAAGAAVIAGGALDDTGEFAFEDWTMPPEKPRSKALWLIPIVLLAGLAVLWAMVFLDSDQATTTTVEAAPTTTVVETTTTVSDTTTTSPETTTSTSTTTTVPWPPPSAWSPVGDPIPAEDLPLMAAGIGDLDFGQSIEDVAGMLTASFGEAELSGVDGVCGPEEGYWLQWGELQVTFDGYEAGSTFVSYQYEDVGSDTSLGLVTLSGLALGDTVETLKTIYSQFTITFEIIDNRDYFRLLSAGELLLWGPVTSPENDGIVEGIYSPSPCTG